MPFLNDFSPPKKGSPDSSAASALLSIDAQQPDKRKLIQNEHTGHWPPVSWDSLLKVPLSRWAFEEFERRTLRSPHQIAPCPVQTVTSSTEQRVRQLKLFARHGGPDLTHIRGYYTLFHNQDGSMSQPGENHPIHKGKGAYSPGFERKLITSGIRTHRRGPKAKNITEIRDQIATRRASLSSSCFGDAEFERFTDLNDNASAERRVMEVFTIIEGEGRFGYNCGGSNHLFNNLDPIGEQLHKAKPDFYDGALPEQVVQLVQDKLRGHIVPCTNKNRPMAPNFFLEAKGPNGNFAVGKLQACYDGALGARAIHSLENYGHSQHEPQYDGKIKTFSFVYHPVSGILQLYGHHMTAPAQGGPPEYHMTPIDAYLMTNNRETFRQGATAFRNLRNMAKSIRNSAIEAANHIAQNAFSIPSGTQTGKHSSSSHQCEDQSNTLNLDNFFRGRHSDQSTEWEDARTTHGPSKSICRCEGPPSNVTGFSKKAWNVTLGLTILLLLASYLSFGH